MTKNETWYQEQFLNFVDGEEVPNYLRGSRFCREVPLSYAMEETSRGGAFMPNASVDFLELDKIGQLHLWEAKKLHSYELTSGRVIGQMLFYDWLFRTYKQEILRIRLQKAGFEPGMMAVFREDEELKFKSWNILVCGGAGYEIASGFNPIMWNYPTIHEDYFKDSVPPIAVYHFYHTNDGMRLRNVWNNCLYRPADMEPYALMAFLESKDNKMYEFEIKENELILSPLFSDLSIKRTDQKMPFELFLKFIGRLHMAKVLGVDLRLFNENGTRNRGFTIDPDTNRIIACDETKE